MLLMFWFSLKVEVIKKLFEYSACLKSKKKTGMQKYESNHINPRSTSARGP